MSRSGIVLVLCCAPGVAWAQNYGTNGTSCNHATLQAAVNAAAVGGTVYVRDGTRVLTSTVVVPKSLTIAGSNTSCQAGTAGHPTLSETGAVRLFEVSTGVLTLEDLAAEGGTTTGSGGTVLLNSGADLRLEGAEVRDGHADLDGGCIYATNGSAVTVDSTSLVEGCDADDDGGNITLAYGASLNVYNGGVVSGGVAGDRGGNLHLEGTASASINGEVSGGSAEFGGGISLATANGGSTPSLTVLGDVIDNHADNDGGGIYADASSGSIRLSSGGTVSGNVAEDSGGGIYLSLGELEATGSVLYGIPTVQSNQALAGSGGGLRVGSGTFTSTYVHFEDNEAFYGVGGAIHALDSTVDLVNASIVWNRAGTGGGIQLDGGDLTLDAEFSTCTPSVGPSFEFEYCSRVDHNTAIDNAATAGGIGIDDGATADIQHTGFLGNLAYGPGAGAIRLGPAATSAYVRNAMILGSNFLDLGVGAVIVSGGDFDVFASTFYDNEAPITWAAGTTGTMSRNVFDDNRQPIVLVAGITGDGNLVQTAAEAPSGVNNTVGDAFLDFDGHPTASSTLVIDQVTTGPGDDLLGSGRPAGADFDRGAIEVQ